MHGVFTMLDGEVYGNTSHASGGGVFVDRTFYYKGGSIHDNTATSAGGGINVRIFLFRSGIGRHDVYDRRHRL